MFKKSYIQPLVSLVLLLVFCLSITPKQYLHDIFAGHRDTAATVADSADAHFATPGINCHCDTLVATSPFTDDVFYITFDKLPEYSSLSPYFYSSPHTSVFFTSVLRGPPAIG